MKIRVDAILPNPEQPRVVFSEAELRELAESMRTNGQIQAIAVEAAPGDQYILIDGERRWRAARLLGWVEIDAVIHILPKSEYAGHRLVLALVANWQRSDLTAIEKARAIRKLHEAGMSNAAIAHRLGVSSTTVALYLRISEQPEEIQDLIEKRMLPVDKRALDALATVPPEHRVKLARKVARDGGASIQAVQVACERFVAAMTGDMRERTPSLRLARADQVDRSRWDALAVLGKIPPWALVVASARYTCDVWCELREHSSEEICKACPLPQMLSALIKAAQK